jgi:sugar phosphate isomerase/epimerase
MSIFVSTGLMPNKSGFDAINYYSKNGINSIELSGGKFLKNQIKNILLLKKNYFKFQVHNYFPPRQKEFILNLASNNNMILKQSINHVKNSIAISRKLKSNYYSFHAGFLCDFTITKEGWKVRNNNLLDRKRAIEIFIDSVKKISLFAKEYKITLMIENNVVTKNNLLYFKKNPFLMSETQEVLSIFKELPSNVKLLMDVAHAKVSARTLLFNAELMLSKCNDLIYGYHFSDNNGIKDSNKKFTKDSWFWPFVKKNLKYYSIEVYASNIKLLKNQIKIAKQKLFD